MIPDRIATSMWHIFRGHMCASRFEVHFIHLLTVDSRKPAVPCEMNAENGLLCVVIAVTLETVQYLWQYGTGKSFFPGPKVALVPYDFILK